MEKLRLRNNYKPAEFENVGLGVYHYRFNFTQTVDDDGDDVIEYDEVHFSSITELNEETANAVLSVMDEEDAERFKVELLDFQLKKTENEFLKEMEDYLAEKGSAMAKKRKELRNKVNKLGKVEQTVEGNGTMEDPIKNWKVGEKVEKGMWYLTEDGYLWECIKNGIPTSTTDKKYFDVVGL